MYKILHVISDKNIGGAGVLLLSLLRHTDRARFEPVLVLPKGSLLAPRARALGVRCLELERGGDRTLSLAAIPLLVRILLEEKPHILHTNASLSARIAALPFHRVISVDTKHCCFAPSARQRTPIARFAFRAFEKISGVHYILTASAVRESLLARGGAAPAAVICGGAEQVEELEQKEKDALRKELGIPKRCFVVGYAARVEHGKGHEYLLEAARLLEGERGVFLLAVGGGSLLDEMRARAKGLSRLRFVGFREDIGRVMNLFDVSLNCSDLSETSPLSISEGMSLGIPPIVTDIGGNAEMARECGIVVPPRAPHALACAILRLKHDRALYARLSHAARARHAALYSAEVMTEKIQTLYLNLIHQSRFFKF